MNNININLFITAQFTDKLAEDDPAVHDHWIETPSLY